jgi:hypothetical protein
MSGCEERQLLAAKAEYLRENKQSHFSCDRGHVVFMCHNSDVNLRHRVAGSVVGIETASRAAFWSAYSRLVIIHRYIKLST